MKIFWTAAFLLVVGCVLADHHRHESVDYGGSEESQLEQIDYPIREKSSRSELRQVVSSLKDLKSCLCKLISVQKKAIELEVTRREMEAAKQQQDPMVGKPAAKPVVEEVTKSSINAPPSPPFGRMGPIGGAPQGVIIPRAAELEEAVTTTTPMPVLSTTQATKKEDLADPSRGKRASDFKEIRMEELSFLSDKGYTFESDEAREAEFLNEHKPPPAGKGQVVMNIPPSPITERKTREVTSTSPKSVEEKSIEMPEVPDNGELTSTYDRMEKKKSLITPLPRRKTIAFPAGATYYSSPSQQSPRDYTLDLPQQTFYLVPAPAPGKSRLVTQPRGEYHPENHGSAAVDYNHGYMDQYPTRSIQAQYAPMEEDYENGGGAVMEHHVGAVEEEELIEPRPKEERKRRKSRKQKKQKVAVEKEEEDDEEKVTPVAALDG